MPSPFPGMDPYLEGELWSNSHTQFAVAIARELNPRLVPRYVAVMGKYQNSMGPETIVSIPVPHVWIKILDSQSRRLVTAIEFLSPANKRGRDRVKYLRKRRRLLLSQAHLVEIDLLRKGKRVPMAQPLPKTDYFAFVSRAQQRPTVDIWPIALNQSLPGIPVPLLEGDNEPMLDLQRVFTTVYDEGNMAYLIDYRQAPDVPLSPDVATWADTLLHMAGKRP